MDRGFLDRLAAQTEDLKGAGLFKPERVLSSPQQPVVRLADGRELINLCANNYLALANHPSIREAAHRALDRYGYGMASVRFICGTQSVHKELEARLSAFLGMDDTILYSSCFDANGGLFETLLDEQDAVISDEFEPREHHRRHPPVQGATPALRQRRHGRARDTASRRLRARASSSSPPTACSRWTVSSRASRTSATSPIATARW